MMMEKMGRMSACVMMMMVMMIKFSPADANSRQKRFLYFNHDTDMTVGLLVGVPISVTLPSLLSGFNWGRSFQRPALPITADERTSDPMFPDQEDKLQSYFRHLQIPEGPCQDRLLCEISSDPENYFPASEILLREVQPAGIRTNDVTPDQQPREQTRLARFLQASKVGFNSGRRQCKKQYRSCPVSVDEVFSRAGLKLWQWLASKLNISFRD